VWGAGMVARVHAEACRSLGWRVAAVAAPTAARAQALAGDIGARAVSGVEATSDRLADIAIVATPPAAHVDDAIALLDAGYHVVVEAPLACTLADADRLRAAEERVGRPILYSEHLAASPAIDAVLAELGELGHPTHLSARAFQTPPTWRTADRRRSWGGGALFDLGVHPIGLVLRVAAELDTGPPRTVAAVITDADSDREHATATIGFDGGLQSRVTVGWQPDTAADWDLQVSSASAVLRVEWYPAPSVELNGDPLPIAGATARPAGPVSLVDDYGYAAQLSRFWATVRTGRPVPATSQLGQSVLDVIAGAHWSAGHGAVEVALPFGGSRDATPADLLAI